MAELIYSMITSLDGYAEAADWQAAQEVEPGGRVPPLHDDDRGRRRHALLPDVVRLDLDLVEHAPSTAA